MLLSAEMGPRLSPWRSAGPSSSASCSCPGRRLAVARYSVCSNVSVSEELSRATDEHIRGLGSSGSVQLSPPRAVHPVAIRPEASADSSPCSRPGCTALVTPARLAALSEALRLPVKTVQDIVQGSPQLLSIPPERLADAQTALQQELRLSARAARQLIIREPSMAIELPIARLRTRADHLAQLLALPSKDVIKAASQIPSILVRDPEAVARQLQRVAQELGIKKSATMLRLATAAPQFLTETPASLAQRLAAFEAVLRRTPNVIVRALPEQPDLLFMSPRVLRNKLAVLQAIFDRHPRLVVPIALACPQLLRCDLDAARAAYGMLKPISGRDADFTFGMVCHAPHLLLEHPQLLARQAQHVHRIARQVPHWDRQLQKLSPAQTADLLCRSAPTYARLHYLVQTNQAAGITLLEVLGMSQSDFLARYPGAESIKQAVRQEVPLPPVPRWEGSKAAQPRPNDDDVPQATQRGRPARTRRRARQQEHYAAEPSMAQPQHRIPSGHQHAWGSQDSWAGHGMEHHAGMVNGHALAPQQVPTHVYVSGHGAQGHPWHESDHHAEPLQHSVPVADGTQGHDGMQSGAAYADSELGVANGYQHSQLPQPVIELHSPGRPHAADHAHMGPAGSGNGTHANGVAPTHLPDSLQHTPDILPQHTPTFTHANGHSHHHTHHQRQHKHVVVHVFSDVGTGFASAEDSLSEGPSHADSGPDADSGLMHGGHMVADGGMHGPRKSERARRDSQLVVSHSNGHSTVIEGGPGGQGEEIEVIGLGQSGDREANRGGQRRSVMQCAAT